MVGSSVPAGSARVRTVSQLPVQRNEAAACCTQGSDCATAW